MAAGRDQGVARRRGRLPHRPGCARLHRVTLGAQVDNLPHMTGREAGPTGLHFTSTGLLFQDSALAGSGNRGWARTPTECRRCELKARSTLAAGLTRCLPGKTMAGPTYAAEIQI